MTILKPVTTVQDCVSGLLVLLFYRGTPNYRLVQVSMKLFQYVVLILVDDSRGFVSDLLHRWVSGQSEWGPVGAVCILAGIVGSIFGRKATHPVRPDSNYHTSVAVERADPDFQPMACPTPPPTDCSWS